jgi:electron transfer flavoprotein beta subunit
MNIIVCMKIVPEEQDIVVNGDHTLSIGKAASKISLYDLNALEEATALAGEGGRITALSVGGERVKNSKTHKDILSRGADALVVVSDPALEGALPETTSTVLAGVAGKLGYDLILCGEGSSDLYAQITGVLTAERLGLPVINCAGKIAAADGALTVERSLDSEREEVCVPLPAVVCVSSDINIPRIPNMKAILHAGKKPVTAVSLADLGVDPAARKAVMQSVLAPQQKERLKNIIEGDSDDKVAVFADNLRKALN